MKQILLWTAIVFGTLFSSVCPGYSGGSGTAEDPYRIATMQDLYMMGLLVSDYDKCFVLTADIDYRGQNFPNALIASKDAFTGTFDGNGHKISGLNISGSGRLGLFGTIGVGGAVKNLGLENIVVRAAWASDTYAGGLAAYNQGTIVQCYSKGTVSGQLNIGGLAGYNNTGSIISCYSNSTVSGFQYLGGLTGNNNYGHIVSCSSGGSVSGSNYIGGLVGNNAGRIVNSCSTSSSAGSNYVGGLTGCNSQAADISNCYSVGAVSGSYSTGGLIGINFGTVSNSFWDIQTSGQAVSAGGTGKTTAEMQLESTFTNSSLTAGKVGNALRLDGLDDYVEVPGYYGIGGSKPRTVSLWVKTSGAVSGTKVLVQWGSNLPGQLWSVYLGDGVAPAISIYGNGIYSRTFLKDSQWHHIAAVMEKGQGDSLILKLYIDGQLDTQSGYFYVNTTQTMPVRMGVCSSRSESEFVIDEVCIYDRALSAEEIAPVYAAGLVAYWKLDETTGTTAYNSVSHNHGLLRNMTPNWVAGKTGNALLFDGVNDYVDVPEYKGIPGGQSRTCCAWVKTKGNRQSDIITWGAEQAGQKWMFRVEANGTLGVGVWGGYYINALATVNDDQWHHVAAVLYDDGSPNVDEILLYIDGNPQDAVATGSQAIDTVASQDVVIGAYKNVNIPGSYFNGIIDDVCIYDRALDPDEFITREIPIPAAGLVARWSMEEVENNTLYDSVSSHDGILKNAIHGPRWDFIDETANGTCDYWSMPAGGGYPVLLSLNGFIPAEPVGRGTETEPYKIATPGELGTMWFRPTACYQLTGDINLEGITWGMAVVPEFGGVLDGDGFRIKNLNVQGSSYLGLIGRIVSAGQVRNLGIENCTINAASNAFYIGGLVGNNYQGDINRCFATGSVHAGIYSNYIGGLAGVNYNSQIRECYSACSVSGLTGSMYLGGLAGMNGKDIVECYSTGPVSGSSSVGGLVGASLVNQVDASFWDIQTSKQTGSAGGTGKTTAEMKTHATYIGYSWIAGKTGNALRLDNVNDYVDVPGFKGVLGGQSRTCCAWIRTSGSEESDIVTWGGEQAGQKWMFRVEANGTLGVGVWGGYYINTLATVNDGQWHHAAAVLYDDGSPDVNEILLYIDGNLQDAVATGSQAIDTVASQDVVIGAYKNAGVPGSYYKGLLDDVCIYVRALNAAEINPEAPISTEGLIAHWPMDEMGGTIVHDVVSFFDGHLRNTDNPGWDFVTSDTSRAWEHAWFIREGLEYPRFVWEDQMPIADAGDDVSVPGWPGGITHIQLDGSGSSDADNDLLHYRWKWTIGDEEFTTRGAAPVVQLPTGVHEITLIVDDGIVDSEPDTVTVTIQNTAPAADAGDDITAYLGFEGNTLEVTLDGSGSSDNDGDALTYRWYEGQTLLSEEQKPVVSLSVGEHAITLIVHDGIADSQADEVVVSVIGPVRANMRITPYVFSLDGEEPFVWAILDMPAGITLDEFDGNYGYYILPGGVQAKWFWPIEGQEPKIIARYERVQLQPYLQAGRNSLTFYGRLNDGRYVGGNYRVYVIMPTPAK